IGNPAEKASRFVQLLQTLATDSFVSELQLQVWDDGTEVGIAAAFAVTIDRSLHVNRSGRNRRKGVRHGQLSIVMAVYAERHFDLCNDCPRDARHVVWKAATVRVAKHDSLRTTSSRRAQSRERILRIG